MATVAVQVALRQALDMAAVSMAAQMLATATAPATGKLDNTFVTGSQYNAPMPIVFGQYRCDAQVVWALQLHRHTKSGHYQATFASLYAHMAQAVAGAPYGGIVAPGDPGGGIVQKIFFNGTLHWDSSLAYDPIHAGWITIPTRSDPPEEVWGGNQALASTFTTTRSPGASGTVAYMGYSGSVFNALNAFVYGNQIPPMHSAVVDGGFLTLGILLRLCLEIQALDPTTQGDFDDVDGILINQSFTRITSGATSSTQVVASTFGMQAGDNLAFGSTGHTTTIASVVDATHITLAASVPTTTGMPVYNGGTSSHFPAFGGVCFQSSQSWGDFMETVCDFYQVDLFESEGKVKARRRLADTADFTILWDDMGAAEYDGAKDPEVRIVETVAYPMDLPGLVRVTYINAHDNFLSGMVTATREGAIGTNTVDKDWSMIACSADQALAAAQGWLDEQYIQQRSFEFTLGPSYYGIEPGDILDVPLDSASSEVVRVRVKEIQDRNPAGTFKVVCVRCSSASFSQSSSGTSGSGTGGGTGSDNLVVAPTGVVWSAPEAYPADPLGFRPNFSVAATWPAGDNRSGLDVWYTLQGTTALIYGGSIGNQTPIGHTTSAMPNGAAVGDFESRSTPILMDQSGDDLATVSEDEAKAGSNYCLVGGELLEIAVFTKTSDSHFTATDMTGGLNGTPLAGHGTTDPFACLSLGEILRVNFAPEIEQAQIGTTVTATLVPYGQDPAGPLAVTYTVVIASPAANAKDPDLMVTGPPTWFHNQCFRTFQLRYNTQNPVVSQYKYQFQRNLNSGGFLGPDGTINSYYMGVDTLEDSYGPGQTLQIRGRAIAPNGSVGSWLASSNLAYVPPNLEQTKFPATVAQSAALASYTVSVGTLTASSNGALGTQDGFSSWSAGSSSTLPTRLLLVLEGANNGLWDVQQVGDSTHPFILVRSGDLTQSGDLVLGCQVVVQQGAVLSGIWQLTGPTAAITLGTTSLTWTRQTGGAGGLRTPWSEAQTGDGVTVAFTMAHTPYSLDNLRVAVRRLVMWNTVDFTVSGNVITFGTAPLSGDPIWIQGSY